MKGSIAGSKLMIFEEPAESVGTVAGAQSWRQRILETDGSRM